MTKFELLLFIAMFIVSCFGDNRSETYVKAQPKASITVGIFKLPSFRKETFRKKRFVIIFSFFLLRILFWISLTTSLARIMKLKLKTQIVRTSEPLRKCFEMTKCKHFPSSYMQQLFNKHGKKHNSFCRYNNRSYFSNCCFIRCRRDW